MKSTKYQNNEERQILTAMIVNDRVLGKIALHLNSDRKPFRSKWCNIVAGWCVKYFEKHGAAPRRSIQSLFRDFAQKAKDEDMVGLMEDFLGHLSADYAALSRETNESYVIDVASTFFNQVKMERLQEQVSLALESKEVAEAQEKIQSFHPVDFSASAPIDVFTDEEAWEEAVEDAEHDVMIHYPNELGEFFGNHLERDGLIAFMGPEKRGKSWWLEDMAWRAAMERRRTIFYSAGDLTKRQMMRRFIVRAARRPIGRTEDGIAVPKGIKVVRDPETGHYKAAVKTERRSWDKKISKEEMRLAREKVLRKTASDDSFLKFRAFSSATLTVAQIDADLAELDKAGWPVDVVVLDYPDILAPEPGSSSDDTRHQINKTWMRLRKLTQDRHCLGVVATQADAASYTTKILTTSNFSEDKRKNAHVTGMIGLNQTPEEKEMGVYRLNWLLLREGFFHPHKCIWVAGCLELANPAMVSTWGRMD